MNIIFTLKIHAQTKINISKFDQKDFERNRVFERTYHLWWSKYNWGPIVKDSLAYFVDDRSYKGVVNYGVEFKSKDYRLFNYLESKTMYFLKVDIESCKFRSNDSIISIEGFVSGGWGDKAKSKPNEPKNYVEVFLGEKTDTISLCYYNSPVNEDKVEIKLKNKIIDKNQILDSFPSFYFNTDSYFRTEPKGKRPFKISAKIHKKTILAFGGSGCYSEIFDIGAMVYNPNKNKKNKIKKREHRESEIIMINNKLVSDIEKEKEEIKETGYYTYTEKAENHILRRQYADAKKIYLELAKQYKNLFARDMHNAIRCAILSRDYGSAFYWGEKLATKNINIKYFNARIFRNLKKNPNWNKFSIRFDSISSQARSRMNFDLKSQLEQLLEEDQVDYGLLKRKEPKVLYETTERVTDKLVELFKKEGYPSEERIGVFTKNDTILISSPDYNVLIRHAIQQKAKSLNILNVLLTKSEKVQEYDEKRIPNNVFQYNSCFHIYKGNLYKSKSCQNNDLILSKIKFEFNNLNNFIVKQGNYVVTEYDRENPQEYDMFYEENFDFIMKLTDDWEFYEK